LVRLPGWPDHPWWDRFGVGDHGHGTGAGVASGQLTAALGATAVVAGIVLVTGLVLLIWGGAMLARAMTGWWRLLGVPAALALLWFVLFPLTVAVFATNRPPGTLGSVEHAPGRADL